ncbi:hypothetical protein ACLOJK_027694 [Asimina triloba]
MHRKQIGADRRGRQRVWAGTQVRAGKTTPVGKKDADGVMEDGSQGGGDADRRRRRRTSETVGRTGEEGCRVADGGGRDGCRVVDRLQQTEKEEEAAGDPTMGGQRLDRARAIGQWLAGDYGWDRVHEM